MFEIRTERTHLHAPAASIQMVIELADSISCESLQTAIKKASARHAILCTHVEQAADGRAFYVPNQDAAPHIAIQETTHDIAAILQRERCTPFDWERGEWMRHFLLTNEGKIIWLFSAHHLAGDGLSMLFFIRDTMCFLESPEKVPDQLPVSLMNEEAIPSSARLSLPLGAGIRLLNAKWEKHRHLFSLSDYQKMAENYWNSRSIYTSRWQIEGNALCSLLAACHDRQVTLTAALITAFMKAAPGEQDVGLAASVRPDGFEEMANWASGISVRHAYSAKRTFWENAQTVHALMRKKLDSPAKKYFLLNFIRALSPTLIDAAYYSAYDGFPDPTAAQIRDMFGYNDHPKGFSVTNLLRAPWSGEELISNVAFYPPMVCNAKNLVGLVTAGQTLTITLQSLCEADLVRMERAVSFLTNL